MGDSHTPLLYYSTTEISRNTIYMVDSIGWRGERKLHVVGVRMDSMVAQELVRSSVHFEGEFRNLGYKLT